MFFSHSASLCFALLCSSSALLCPCFALLGFCSALLCSAQILLFSVFRHTLFTQFLVVYFLLFCFFVTFLLCVLLHLCCCNKETLDFQTIVINLKKKTSCNYHNSSACFFPPECNETVGLQDGRVKNSQLSASSYYTLQLGQGQLYLSPQYGRVGNAYSWCSQVRNY